MALCLRAPLATGLKAAAPAARAARCQQPRRAMAPVRAQAEDKAAEQSAAAEPAAPQSGTIFYAGKSMTEAEVSTKRKMCGRRRVRCGAVWCRRPPPPPPPLRGSGRLPPAQTSHTHPPPPSPCPQYKKAVADGSISTPAATPNYSTAAADDESPSFGQVGAGRQGPPNLCLLIVVRRTMPAAAVWSCLQAGRGLSPGFRCAPNRLPRRPGGS